MERSSSVWTWMTVTALVAVTVVDAGQVGPRTPQYAPPPTPLWRIAGHARAGAAADATTAYFVSQRHDVLAVDTATGQVRWQAPTGEYGDYHWGEAAVASGSVVVVGDYNLVAFERDTGRWRWRFVPTEGYGPGIYLGAAVGSSVLAGSPAGRAYAVDVETGNLRWAATVSAEGRTTVYSPTGAGATVVAGFTDFTLPATGGVVAMAAQTGQVLWKRYFPRPDEATLATNFAGGLAIYEETSREQHRPIAIAASGDGVIYGFDLASGDIVWSIPRLPPTTTSVASPERDYRALAIAGGMLVSGSLTGHVRGYDLKTRDMRWDFYDRWVGSTAFRIASAEGVAYIPHLSGMVIALDAHTGKELWRMGDWSAGFIWPPAFSNERIIISGSGYGFVALPRVLPH